MCANARQRGHLVDNPRTPHKMSSSNIPEPSASATAASSSSRNQVTYEEMSEGSTIPLKVWRSTTNPRYWDLDIDLDAPPNDTQINTYFARVMMDIIHLDLSKANILGSLVNDFEGWTSYQFNKVDRTFKKVLLNIIEARGIPTSRGPYTSRILRLIEAEKAAEDYPLQAPEPAHVRQTIEPPPQMQSHETSRNLRAPTVETQAARQTPPGTRYMQEVGNFPQQHGTALTAHSVYMDNAPYDLPPTRIVDNGPIDPQQVSTFQKGWRKDRNYTGKPYDLLYDKVRIFIGYCRRLQITEDQYHAVFPDILSGRAEDFYIYHIGPDKRWDEVYNLMDTHFNTTMNHSQYWADWTTLSFVRVRKENPDKTLPEVLETLLDKLQLVQRALGEGYQGEIALRTTVVRACRAVPELEPAMINQKPTCEALFADLRAALQVAMERDSIQQFMSHEEAGINFVDRRYSSNFKDRQRTSYNHQSSPQTPFRPNNHHSSARISFRPRQQQPFKPYRTTAKTMKCFVCKKDGCWSTNHTDKERIDARKQYLQACEDFKQEPILEEEKFATYLLEYEGEDPLCEVEGSLFDPWDTDNEAIPQQNLVDFAFNHRTTGEDIYTAPKVTEASQFVLHDPYSTKYQGELWDTGAAKFSTVGMLQALAYVRENPGTKIKWGADTAKVKFGDSDAISAVGTIKVVNQLGSVTYHILDTSTPFLFSLYDADRLKAYFNNLSDVIVQGDTTIPVVRKWGHAFFNTSRTEAGVFLTEPQLRRLHRRFGHPRTDRLYKLLRNAGHDDVEEAILEKIQKFCHFCQLHDPSPRRFKFSIKDESHFNYEVVIDVVHLGERNVLHVIDSDTSFQAATFLNSLSARDTWNALCKCWIYTYIGPPDHIVHDPGTNFASEEFRNNAKIMGITCEEMPIEAHWALGKVERSHGPLRRAFEILKAEIGYCTDDETLLQMAVKALNDTAGPNGIVPTLLVFGAYPRISQDSPPSPDIARRALAVQKAMKMLRTIRAEVEVNRAINTRNGPDLQSTLSLPIQSDVLIWRENKGWKGPYKVDSIEGHTITVGTTNGPIQIRATHVKPYYRTVEAIPQDELDTPQPIVREQPQPRKRGRPRKATVQAIQPRRRGRPRRAAVRPTFVTYMQWLPGIFLTQKEKDSYDLAVKLRQDNVITTPGRPFEESDALEIDALASEDVFQFIRYDARRHSGLRIFKTRMVREVKNRSTKPIEKSRLVVQGYGDSEKEAILTQAPTIQRMSQGLILALGPTLVQQFNCQGELRDITQAYTQSRDPLTRTILAELPAELHDRYPPGTILLIQKPLYGLAESGLHWYKTYHSHHTEALEMKVSTYDPCLLFTTNGPHEFGLVGMQTDDTFGFATPLFSGREEKELEKKKFRAKDKQMLGPQQPIEFNGGRIELDEDNITFVQKGQIANLRLIDPEAEDRPQQYVAQRARGAYVASICQPEAAYDLSVAAQIKDPEKKDIEALNVRIKWQMENPERGITFVPLDLERAKLYVFTDGSFANNMDLSSQLGFIIVLAMEAGRTREDFEICGNIIHWSSTKCKRVTRSVLASELYGMMTGFDSGMALSTTLNQIMTCLEMPRIPVVICTDSRSLYDCLVRLGTTDEKRLMIDIMSLREAYEKKEISEVRWIDGKDNPADACTKKAPNGALEKLISTNTLKIRVEAYVERLS